MKKILLLVAVLLPVATAAGGKEPVAHRLFHIERNKNANIVAYDAMVLPDGSLHDKDPVVVYWERLAEDGRRKELNWAEKKMAYGFSVKERNGARLNLEMKADIGRPVVVDALGDEYKAFIEVGEQLVVLDKVFIFAVDKFPYPQVEYVELFGHDPDSGEELYEKFEP